MRRLLPTLLLVLSQFLLSQQSPIYKNPNAPVEERVGDLLQRMTLEEKIAMLGGVEGFSIRANERLGIPKIKMADGPLGVRNYGKATAFPAGIAVAASWNVDLMHTVGEAVGNEARAKGVHIMLSPGVNIYRAPMCGRNFEYFGEDPYLASRMTVAYIEGVQSKGVVATVKHFAANNQEYDRHNVSSDVDKRTLHEIYLPTFEAAVTEAHAGAVMNSYNPLNGVHASQNYHLLTEILKNQWKFDGFVMSDWGSTYDGVAAANAGLDLEMPSAEFMNERTILSAIKDGRMSESTNQRNNESTIDDKIRRMLRVMFRFGFFDRAQVDSTIPRYNPDSRLVALQAAREGIVLLKNSNNVLPLDPKKIKSIAVIGPNAYPAVTGGGGSSRVEPFRAVSTLEAVIARAGEGVRVSYSPGASIDVADVIRSAEYGTQKEDGSLVQGLRGEYFSNMNLTGSPVFTRIDRRIDFQWLDGSPASGLPADGFSVRWTGGILVDSPGGYEFLLRGDDGYRMMVDGEKIIDEWHDQGTTTRMATKVLTAGIHFLTIEYYENGGEAQIAFGWKRREQGAGSEEMRVAAKADVAIVCVGFNAETEGEGFDRPFNLPAEQEELIRKVSKVNKKTIVVLNAGGAVSMSLWLDDPMSGSPDGLLHAWYPGQEGGTAIAEVLFGDVNPSGKLPATFEKRWEDNATYSSYYDSDNDKHVKYSEGIFVGYRHFDKKNFEPLFPFGYGLSYTTFQYRDLKIGQEKGRQIAVSFVVKNTGKREGAEAAQVYVHAENSAVSRPVKELKGFSKVLLKPGEAKKVEVKLDARSFSYYDTTSNAWISEVVRYEILVGSSSRDVRLRGKMTMTGN